MENCNHGEVFINVKTSQCLYPSERVSLLKLPVFEPNLVWSFFSASHQTQQVDINVTLTSNFSGAISCGIAFDDFKEEIYNVTAKDGKFSIQVGHPP